MQNIDQEIRSNFSITPCSYPVLLKDSTGKITTYIPDESKIEYRLGSHVYVNTNKLRLAGDPSYHKNKNKTNHSTLSTKPFMIATITEIRLTSAKQVIISAHSYNRVSDLPENAFHLIWHGRKAKYEKNKDPSELPSFFYNPDMQCRELFLSVSEPREDHKNSISDDLIENEGTTAAGTTSSSNVNNGKDGVEKSSENLKSSNSIPGQNNNNQTSNAKTNNNNSILNTSETSGAESHDNNSEEGQKPENNNRSLTLVKETFPASALAGLCEIKQFRNFSMSNIRKMKLTNLDDDTFFNILGYSCESKRLVTLNSNYEVHIGACYEWTAEQRGMYQEAKLPDLTSLSYDKKSYYESHKENSNYEKLIWEPKISEKEYTNFISESRELVSNICAKNSNNNNNQINNEGNSGSYSERDEITFNSLNTLYHCNMSTTKAMQMLGKNPMPVPVMAKWPDDEVKIFTKGLKSFGKNFSKIKVVRY